MSAEGGLTVITDCRGCGVCCLHMGYPAFNLPLEELRGEQAATKTAELPVRSQDRVRWNQLPASLRAELQAHIREYRAPKPGQLDLACIWLDPTTRVCKHHEHRPQICRDFEIGSAPCLEWRRAYSDLIQLGEQGSGPKSQR